MKKLFLEWTFQGILFLNVGIVLHYHLENMAADAKEIQIILRFLLVIAMYCQAS